MIELASNDVIQEVADAIGAEAPWHMVTTESTTVIRRDGDPVAIFGCPPLWPGFGQAWGFVNFELAEGHGLWLTREVRKVMKHAMDKFNHRQARALCFTPEQIRWARLVGFTLEGVWKDAGPESQDVFIMVYHRRN